MECLCCNFIKFIDGIGSKGHVASYVHTNGGKSNASGGQDCNSSIARVNHTQSLDAIKRMNYCFRQDILGEKCPAFEKLAKYYNVPALRRDTDESTPVN